MATTALTNTILLGKDCGITVDGSNLSGVSSCSISYSADSIDVSTRDDSGYSKALPGKKSVSISLELKAIQGNAAQQSLFSAWKADLTGVTVAITDGATSVSGVFVIESIEESQELDDAVNLSVSLKNYGAVTVGGSSSSST